MRRISRLWLAVLGFTMAGQAAAQVTLYERDGFQGRSVTTSEPISNLGRSGFKGSVSSVTVQGDRSDRWEVCEDQRYRGRCAILRPGDYPSLAAMGLNDRVSSVRAVARDARYNDDRYAPAPPPSPAQANQIVFYEHEGFKGRSLTVDAALDDFRRSGFNDSASSVVVIGERWEVCQDIRYAGRCFVLRPGQYASLAAMGLGDRVSSVRMVSESARVDDRRYAPMQQVEPVSQVVFYEHEGFEGRSFTADAAVGDFRRSGFNDRASSAVVRGERWEVCDQAGYVGRCTVLRPGQYASLTAMGLNDRVSSVRAASGSVRIEDGRYAPAPVAVGDYGRRQYEQTYEASITSVRAVVEDAGERCWVEQQQVAQEGRSSNVPGALIGAVIGGVLGHQVGGGSGKDLATGVGAVAGAVIGANSGSLGGGQQTATQDVRRCVSAPGQGRPAYWDVTYNFRGVEHRMQMTKPPGATVTVNERGEPRV
ncbi:beta/gamma crystallin-related protein [Hydrogenophaga sp.]|uniref:beta/gamma crystallin-related protein n=1 Tax=Hydrogenophaga sp. TaxID=1904254 RepID=UPI0025BEC4B1|nr:beta/gamma crystallin-related protein [Hydrogenophaga sp.]